VKSLIGIDAIELKKAASFYKIHQDRLDSFFVKKEADFIRQSPKPHESLAMILAAKEAVFKAFSLPWMGLTGFKNIEIIPHSDKEFFFRLHGRLRKFSSKKIFSGISFLKRKNYVVATCHPVASLSCAGI